MTSRTRDDNVSSRRTVVITGGNTGMGFQVALALAKPGGWHVVVACRNVESGRKAAADLAKTTGGTAETLPLDLASLKSVRAFALQLRATVASRPPVHALVCNAGSQTVSGTTLTADGFESTFGVNHLGHFLLVHLLLPELARPARVVFVSSGTHDPTEFWSRVTGMTPPRLRPARQMAYPAEDAGPVPGSAQSRGREAYTTSKLCNLLTSNELARRLATAGDAVTSNAYDPGLMPGTGLARDASRVQRFAWHNVLPVLARLLPGIRTPASAGKHLARLVDDTALEGVSGKYFSGGRENTPSALAQDPQAASRLWQESEELVS